MSKFSMSILVLGLVIQSCTRWDPGFQMKGLGSDSISAPLSSVDRLFEQADNAATLSQVINGYTAYFPGNLELSLKLAEAHILYAAAYAQTKGEKGLHYRKGIQYAEWSMAQNPDFAVAVSLGQKVGEASQHLQKDDMKAMLLWVTGVSYYYKECLSGLGHVFNAGWMVPTKSVLERLNELEPQYEFGAVLFSRGIYDVANPFGNKQRAVDLLNQAVDSSQGALLARWGRAKYWYQPKGQKEALKRDLIWVIHQDPKTAPSPYRWNVYFQRDAQAMLRQEGWPAETRNESDPAAAANSSAPASDTSITSLQIQTR